MGRDRPSASLTGEPSGLAPVVGVGRLQPADRPLHEPLQQLVHERVHVQVEFVPERPLGDRGPEQVPEPPAGVGEDPPADFRQLGDLVGAVEVGGELDRHGE